MSADRTIGRTVRVKTYQALVELAQETSSYVKSSLGGLYAIAAMNSFVIIPVGSERVVAVVTGLDMAEEPEASMRNRQMLVIAKPRRTMWVSMIGTITQTTKGKAFEYGVRRYPELDNPVWFANDEDLDIIFDTAQHDDPRHITIGTSPIFTDYKVTIDIDRFFGKHAAILGNTGSGKSCTVTALIRAVLDRGMPNAHFIIFDTNNEYERAFTAQDKDHPEQKQPLYNRLVLRNDGDTPTGLHVPHWFMDGSDYLAFFRPGEAAQAPLLFRAIGVARSQSQQKSALLHLLATIEDVANQMQLMVSNPAVGPAAYYAKRNLREQIDAITTIITRRAEALENASIAMYQNAFQSIRATATAEGSLDAYVDDAMREHLAAVREQLAQDRRTLAGTSAIPIGVDSPAHFDFDEFVDTIFEEQLAREAQRDQRLRSYVGTLQLRLEQARQDPRYAFLFRVQPFSLALASFLRLLFGLNPTKHFAEAPPPWKDAYEQQYPAGALTHQITILDLSQLASEVLENVTALLGRLVLEFMQRLPNEERGTFPVVLILEEAHHYIPANARLERQQRAREVFEKIAKEGRKFGLSLVVASQRPSELSRTVLAQCNSFIVHRIQNPDDQDYFKSVISGINRELLDQLPALAQQQAIVLGDCVRLPLQVRINDVNPRPRSDNPHFVDEWSRTDRTPPDIEAIAAQWEGTPEED
jgi:ABC-type dipeptide/oligopeptide/nickel transport system ATPase component